MFFFLLSAVLFSFVFRFSVVSFSLFVLEITWILVFFTRCGFLGGIGRNYRFYDFNRMAVILFGLFVFRICVGCICRFLVGRFR